MGIQVLQGVEIRRKPRSIGPDPPWNKGPRSDERSPIEKMSQMRPLSFVFLLFSQV